MRKTKVRKKIGSLWILILSQSNSAHHDPPYSGFSVI